MNTSVHHSEEICKRLSENNLLESVKAVSESYIISIMMSMLQAGYHGKTVDMESYSDRHRTSISRFLCRESISDDELASTMKQCIIKIIYDECVASGCPIFVITDDTIFSKTIPSTKARHPIEAAAFHFSHLKRKQDYGHQAVAVLLSCNGITLPYDTIMYDKSVSKIEIVKQIAQKLPCAPIPSYFLCDSWYVCEKLTDAFICNGFYTVGAMKTNRTLYPYGVKMNVCDFAGKLVEAECRELFHLVTVKQRQYYVYRYEGNLNGVENAVVLLTYPKNAFGKEKALRAFISTNAALSDEEILNLYVTRWSIEVYFRDCKSKLALGSYQIRSANGIKRLWLIASLVYLLACLESVRFCFAEGFHLISKILYREQVSFIFDYAANGGDKSVLLQKIA